MKILHIIDSGGFYGAEVMLLNLMEEQRSLDHHPCLCSIGGRGVPEKPIETEARRKILTVRPWRMADGPNLPGALGILRFARREGFDILHSHGYKGNILFGLLPRWLRRLPLVSTIHGWTNTGALNRMKLYEWLDAKSLGGADRVVAVNRAMLEKPQLRNASFPVTVIENGIPIFGDGNAPQAVDVSTLDQGITAFCQHGFTVGAIGRLSPEKGYDDLIQAVAKLLPRIQDIRLVIIGEGGQRGALEQLIRQNSLETKVILPGYRLEASRYMPSFNVLVLSSLTEGLPITLLEAMVAQTPVVATEVGGMPAVLRGGGLLVPPQDTTALADAIAAIHDDPTAAAARAASARAEVSRNYSSRRMAREYQKVYLELLAPMEVAS